MPWTPPNDPIPSTVITTAFDVANHLSQIRWLRLMTGNADPPATSYVVVSDSTSTTSWRKVPADALAAGAIATHLGYTPANAAGQAFSGPVTSGWPLTVASSPVVGAGGRLILGGDASTQQAVLDVENSVVRLYSPVGLFLRFNVSNGALHADGSIDTLGDVQASRLISLAPVGTAPLVIGSTTQVANLNATYVANRTPGAGPGNLPILDGAGKVAVAVSADTAANATQVGGRTASTSPIPNGIPAADGAGKIDAGWIPAGAGGGGGGDAASVTGHVPTATPAPNALPLSDASGKLAAGWLPAAAGGSDVPVGLIALWNSGTAPTGWTFETRFDGRFPLGAGGALGLTLASPPGGAATYDHSINIAHGHNDTISVGGTVAADASSPVKVTVVTPGDANAALSGHGHGFTGSKGGGVTALANPTNLTTGALGHLPPYATINYIRKT